MARRLHERHTLPGAASLNPVLNKYINVIKLGKKVEYKHPSTMWAPILQYVYPRFSDGVREGLILTGYVLATNYLRGLDSQLI